MSGRVRTIEEPAPAQAVCGAITTADHRRGGGRRTSVDRQLIYPKIGMTRRMLDKLRQRAEEDDPKTKRQCAGSGPRGTCHELRAAPGTTSVTNSHGRADSPPGRETLSNNPCHCADR